MSRRRGRRGGGPQRQQQRPLPPTLDALPYMTPQMLDNFRRIGVHSPADLRGRSGDDLYAALQRTWGEVPQHSVLYVLRAMAHFMRTGERRDWREFEDTGFKGARRRGPAAGQPRGRPGHSGLRS